MILHLSFCSQIGGGGSGQRGGGVVWSGGGVSDHPNAPDHTLNLTIQPPAPPPKMATAAVATHPTGMHTCSY